MRDNKKVTPHIHAKPFAFSDICLMPGDPLRAQYIAKNYLDGITLVNDVRNMYGYTGTYKDRKISVMGSGIGIPSASIYYKELITEYGVNKLIRVGSCGAISANVQLNDIVIGMGASTDSKTNRIRFKDHDFAAIADFNLLKNTVNTARKKQLLVKVGNLFSTDLFYNLDHDLFNIMVKYGILGIEMEAAGLYGVCAEYGAKGLTICTVSDHIRTGDSLSPNERQSSFNVMIELALDSILLED